MFRTEVQVSPADLNLTLKQQVLTMGSCFAEVIGSKLHQNKVDVLVNPFGTIFNPVSVCLLLQSALGKPYSFKDNLVAQNGVWYAYDLHSSLSSQSKEALLQTVQERQAQCRSYLRQASLLIITLGTAVSYRLKQSGKLVANCHKLPAANFVRELLPLEEMQAAFEETYQLLKAENPTLKVLLTVSPVRHTKETIPVNSVSKSLLRVLSHQLQEAHEDVLYFPAYEMMMDDLRDYRFYKEDMLHPTPLAEDYIWQKFVDAFYAPEFRQFMGRWAKVQRAVAHRPFHPYTAAHQSFVRNTLEQIQTLERTYGISASAETKALQQQLTP
ncbi:GSCFA domain-containing protein [Pontibacter actiniarum]|uniref:GSCFA domain-containing protein n=1 Tax=Pontibacter actiniarum TaxID=323450 RepID=A0A1X9YMT0_9BACT|nr:GSCFA domain-containing protein [Pontibacter actiniarum]ARS34180.1 hypothetical protein CA264_01260 [Pontibacter actiniarum]